MQDWAKRIANGDTRALARAATAIENREPGADALLAELQKYTTSTPLVLGVTGAPGAGKSTLVDRLAGAFRKLGKTVAIIAVDPTSAVTGGALLVPGSCAVEHAARIRDARASRFTPVSFSPTHG